MLIDNELQKKSDDTSSDEKRKKSNDVSDDELQKKSDDSSVVLFPNQIDHFNFLSNTFKDYHCAVDTSDTGSGKTIIALKICQYFQLNLFVICPVTTKANWQIEAKKYNVKMIDCLSYDTLRSRKVKDEDLLGKLITLKHGWLKRKDEIVGEKTKKTTFSPTKRFLTKVVDKGTLVVFDEYYKIKNMNPSYKACLELSKAVWSTNKTCSRCLFSTGTPSGQNSSIQLFLRLFGIMRQTKVCYKPKDIDHYLPSGFNEILKVCNDIDKEKTQKYSELKNKNKQNYMKAVQKLYKHVIKTVNTSSCCKNEDLPTIDAKNCFYNV